MDDVNVGKMDTERYLYIDVLRSIAILCVVLCHSVEEGVYDLSLNGIVNLSNADAIIAYSLFTIGRLGAPIFLMISGYLLLDRRYDESTIFKFWRKNCTQLLLCTQIWFAVYDVILILFGNNISITTFLADVLFIHQVPLSHVWYLPMIIGLYYFLPFVANALSVASKNVVRVGFVVAFCVLFLCPFIIYNLHSLFPTHTLLLSRQISEGFSGGKFGFYIIAGYLIKRGLFREVKSCKLYSTLILCFLLAVAFQMWNRNVGIAYNIWYDNPLLFICSFSAFELIKRIVETSTYRRVQAEHIRWFSSYAFSLYLVHNIIKMALIDSIISLDCYNVLKVIILWVLLIVFGVATSWVISCIPYVGNWLIYRDKRR